ncbi:MAG: hypothetical protein ABSH20_04740 [Tepidisphaeraceae bacterium]|jgi:hypothetical protein
MSTLQYPDGGFMRKIGLVVVIVLACWSAVPRAAETPGTQPTSQPSVFDLPAIQVNEAAAQQMAAALFAQHDYAQVERQLKAFVARIPFDYTAFYNLACAQARLDKLDESLDNLEKSVELGYREAAHIETDEDLKPLRDKDRFAAIVEKAKQPLTRPAGITYHAEPESAKNGQVLISEKNVLWDTRLGSFYGLFKLDREVTVNKPIINGFGETGDLLREWYKEGTAAGNNGDLYDNHDGDHSALNMGNFPQMTRIQFADAAKKRGLHYGLQVAFLYNGVTIGNSSTALTAGPLWRSQGRHALTQQGVPARLYLQYIGNHLYFYPSHHDHLVGHNGKDGKGHGDVLTANTPYIILSQGSSGSDQPFMNAAAATLAAFRPDVKQKLAKSGMLMPAVQWAFRMSNKPVQKPEDYLKGEAHPSVFDAQNLDMTRMVRLAHDLTEDNLPPRVMIRLVQEDQPKPGVDFFDSGGEKIFETPGAIARVIKSTQYAWHMTVSAETSKDLNGKALTYHWAVLRGDAEAIQIKKQNEAGSVAEIVVPYHERRPVTPGSALESNRVDIGVFVHNGTCYSAPAFISLNYLDNQKRVYDEQHRIVSVDYAEPEISKNYIDPLLDARKDWRDDYHYAEDGKLLGWTRTRGDKHEEFTADGLLVVTKDSAGNAKTTAKVRYVPKRASDGIITLEEAR